MHLKAVPRVSVSHLNSVQLETQQTLTTRHEVIQLIFPFFFLPDSLSFPHETGQKFLSPTPANVL